MKKLLACIKGDIFLQRKYGIYAIYTVVTIAYLLLLKQIPWQFEKRAVSIIVLTDPSLLGFFFIGGLILLEKGEGTLTYLTVTPLGIHAYLGGKMISLTLLSVITGEIIAFFSYGSGFHQGLFILGIILTSCLFILIGFIAVIPFHTVNKYFLASMLYMTIFFSPFLDHFKIYSSWLFYLLPTRASMLLIFGAFQGISVEAFLYSIAWLSLWIVGAYRIAYKGFLKYIVTQSSAF